jgi:hypothetical protein
MMCVQLARAAVGPQQLAQARQSRFLHFPRQRRRECRSDQAMATREMMGDEACFVLQSGMVAVGYIEAWSGSRINQ